MERPVTDPGAPRNPPQPRPALRPRQAPRDAVPVAGHTALTVRPGQKLIVTVSDTIAEHAKDISTTLQDLLPGVEVIVLGGVQQIAVYDPASPESGA